MSCFVIDNTPEAIGHWPFPRHTDQEKPFVADMSQFSHVSLGTKDLLVPYRHTHCPART